MGETPEPGGAITGAAGPPAGSDRGADADAELGASLAGLSRLALGQGQNGLEIMLRQVAEFATRAIPGADGAGLTLLENNRADTIVVSSDLVRAVDDIQYGIGEGPCISAVAEGRTVRSGSLSGDAAWPRFGPRVGRLGVHSVVSLPLIGPDGVVGAMNVYARSKHAFTDDAVALGELFAAPAAVSVLNARALHQTQRLAVQLQTALGNRAVIDQAIGIVMSRAGCTPDEAFDRLRAVSQSEQVRLLQVAQRMVEEAVARARARRALLTASVGHTRRMAVDLIVLPRWVVPAAELRERFSRSSGPGGQGVNTADSRVELSFDIAGSPTVPADLRDRVMARLAGRLVDGVLTIAAGEHRAQLSNRDAARRRMVTTLRMAAAAPPRARRPTRPTRGSQERRIAAKKRRGEIKRGRGTTSDG